MAEVERPPRPYLTREDTNERLRVLGFILGPESLDYPAGHQKAQFVALQEIIAGAITEWADLSPEIEEGEDPTQPGHWDRLEAELQEWTEEWLVG